MPTACTDKCPHCGKEGSIMALAWATWSVDLQDWVHYNLSECNHRYCTQCGADGGDLTPISNLKVAAEHAIKQAANTP